MQSRPGVHSCVTLECHSLASVTFVTLWCHSLVSLSSVTLVSLSNRSVAELYLADDIKSGMMAMDDD